MKIFISWSKDHARRVALVLKEFLPQIFDGVDVFMSDDDIEPGERSLRKIEVELSGTSFGLLVVTAENQHESWLNFEAGALSKALGSEGNPMSRVVPLLVDLRIAQLIGPLSQFQAVPLDHEGLRKTVGSIARLVGTELEIALRRLDWAWPNVQGQLADANKHRAASTQPRRSDSDKIDELLELVRAMHRTPLRFRPDADDDIDLDSALRERDEVLRESAARAIVEARRRRRRTEGRIVEEVDRAGGRVVHVDRDGDGDVAVVFVEPDGKEFPFEDLALTLMKLFGRKIEVRPDLPKAGTHGLT
jgi:hypothetical protein